MKTFLIDYALPFYGSKSIEIDAESMAEAISKASQMGIKQIDCIWELKYTRWDDERNS